MGLTLEDVAREVNALEMVELIQGVRMGLGVGVLRDEGADEEDDDAASEEEEVDEEGGENNDLEMQENHNMDLPPSQNQVLSDLKRRQAEKLDRLLSQNEEKLARVERENQERLETTKRENEERSRRTVSENEQQVAQLLQDNEAEVAGLIAHLWKRGASNARLIPNLPASPPPLPECPVCFDQMAPPTNIFQCANGHLIGAQCRLSLEPCICPRCRSDIPGRATDMEQFLRTIY